MEPLNTQASASSEPQGRTPRTPPPSFEREDTNVLDEFVGRFDNLTTALTINDFLRSVAYLLVQNQISNRLAAVLTTICGHLLRTVPLVDPELCRDQPQPPPVYDWRCDTPPKPEIPPHPASQPGAQHLHGSE
jgi:hypothetical protein